MSYAWTGVSSGAVWFPRRCASGRSLGPLVKNLAIAINLAGQ
jgi:hypothetical protein